MAIEKIGVIGAGQMGHGIALVAAKAGFDVIVNLSACRGICLNKSLESEKVLNN